MSWKTQASWSKLYELKPEKTILSTMGFIPKTIVVLAHHITPGELWKGIWERCGATGERTLATNLHYLKGKAFVEDAIDLSTTREL